MFKWNWSKVLHKLESQSHGQSMTSCTICLAVVGRPEKIQAFSFFFFTQSKLYTTEKKGDVVCGVWQERHQTIIWAEDAKTPHNLK